MSDSPQSAAVSVTVWSDFTCPFCHVARDRVEWLRQQEGVEVGWRPYDLHPEYPDEGISREALGLTPDSKHETTVRRLALEVDLPYNPHPEWVPRTRRALELVEWARGQGGDAHERLHERIMDARWAEAREITGWDELTALADDVGLDGAEGRAAVEAGLLESAVSDATQWAQRAGIRAVPAFVFDERLLVSGAVPSEMLQTALDRVRESEGTEG